MKQNLKTAATLLGMFAACWIFIKLVVKFLWMCYDAGIPM